MAYWTSRRVSVGPGEVGVNSSAKILFSKETGCETTWFGFEQVVVNGWPIDLVRIYNDRFVYKPLGIDAKRIPLKDASEGKLWEGRDGLLAWRDEAPFDIEW
jgi:hypothetical protein